MKRKNASKGLYDPKIQLEDLPEGLEGPYQRMIAYFARCLPGAAAVFVAVTLVEGTTGILADRSGKAWLDAINRLPSAIGGQGNLSAGSIAAMARHRFSTSQVRALFVGDSVISPNLGGGTANELALEQIVSSHVPASLNLAQEGGEWGMNSLLIQKLAQDPGVQAQKPLLIVDVNFKFYGTYSSFSPAFPIETYLCANRPDPTNPFVDSVCSTLSRDWPKTLAAVSHHSPLLTRGLLGQLDFFMTFLQRAPVYEYNVKGWGFHPFRTFKPGIVDATKVAEAFKANPPAPWHTHYRGLASNMNNYIGIVYNGFSDPAHPKHIWLKSLAHAVAKWPGPALVLWIHPSPEAQNVFNDEVKAKIEDMRTKVIGTFTAHGKQDLHVASTKELLPESYDFSDSDHPSPQGHKKIADFINTMVLK